jgi:putative endonuclease
MSYYVYIMSSKSGVLYIGATNDLDRRVFEHKQGLIEGFTKKYRATRMVYVEEFDRPAEMVARERQLKGCTRSRKLELDSQAKSRNGGLRAEDRARSFASAAAAQDDPQRAKGQRTMTQGEFDSGVCT